MSYRSQLPLVVLLAITSCGLSPRQAQAGPLLDWLFGRSRTAAAYPVGTPIPIGNGTAAGYAGSYGPGYNSGYAASPTGYAGNYGTYYSSQLPAIGPAGAGYTAPMPTGIAAATLPSQLPPTLSYVPNFQTNAQRAPVTYYRPLLSTDPNTGAQVVAMAPCSSYEYMTQRVPELGRSALFGSNAPPVFQSPPQALPTYTLPSGGVPLTYSTPSITAPYTTAYGAYGTNGGYGAYTTMQPPVGAIPLGPATSMVPSSVGPAGNYPTAPLGQSAYYGSNSGGSSGAFSGGGSNWQSTPGLVAPQAPAGPATGYPAPNYQTPSYQAPAYPPTNSAPPTTYAPVPGSGVAPGIAPSPSFSPVPNTGSPSGIFPPAGPGGSADPANYPPQLQAYPPVGTSAQSNLRPQLRSYTSQPRAGESPRISNSSSDDGESNSRQLPTMLPIPAPEDFKHEPRWSPPLLRDGDMTAMRPVEPHVAQLAGHLKPIHWASFESVQAPATAATQLHPSPTVRLRPILSPTAPAMPAAEPSPAIRPAATVPRDTGGWKASR